MAKQANAVKKLAVTLMISLAKKTLNQIANVRGLGLRRIHQTVEVIDTPANRGMINKVSFMLKVEEAK